VTVPAAPPSLPAGTAEEPAKPAVTVTSPLWEATFDQRGRLLAWTLTRYSLAVKGAAKVDLVAKGEANGRALELLVGDEAVSLAYSGSATVSLSAPGELLFSGTTAEGLGITKKIRLDPASYRQSIAVEVTNPSDKPVPTSVSLLWGPAAPPKDADEQVIPGGVAFSGGKVRTIPFAKLKETTRIGAPDFLGIQTRYFLAALIPGPEGAEGFFVPEGNDAGTAGIVFPAQVPAAGALSRQADLYLGPKAYALLKAARPGLEQTIDFGFFSLLATPLYHVLRWFHSLVGSYGVAIILLTVIIKLILTPLTHKQYNSMREMQALAPKVKRLREKLKGDPQKLNQETMALYKEHGVNPLGGCLPMLLQIPVFWALYNVLIQAIEMRQEPFLYLKDLATYDPYYISPILMGASMYVQQVMTPAGDDPMQNKMMRLMPVIFTFFFLKFPAGLVIYWLVNNLLTIVYFALVKKK
jgi:YidC/Oxa1 family membrane protein insertase